MTVTHQVEPGMIGAMLAERLKDDPDAVSLWISPERDVTVIWLEITPSDAPNDLRFYEAFAEVYSQLAGQYLRFHVFNPRHHEGQVRIHDVVPSSAMEIELSSSR